MNNKLTGLLFFIILMNAEAAYAYLDPASGNAIVSFLIAIFGSAIFFIKSIFYKIFSRSSSSTTFGKGDFDEQSMPVIFSEGETYWTTFRPIVEELISQKIHFRYITLDLYDTGLEIDSEFMHSKRYSQGRLSFAKIANISSPVMLSTTPNLGCSGYPMPRPLGVKNLVHVFHAMVDVSCYRKGSLDFYDSVLMVGAHEEYFIRLVEQARHLEKKKLIVAGLPCLDDLSRQKDQLEIQGGLESSSYKTVLIAPSWGRKGCFSEYGTDFVKTLSAKNYRVIIRLHPHSYIYEPDAVVRWKSETRNLSNVTWDDNTYGTQAMSQADILISDASSIRFDFAFLYQRPVITLPISRQSREIFESDYMSETWADGIAEKIGVVASLDKLHLIDRIVDETINQVTPQDMGQLRDQYVANYGSSAVTIVAYLNEQTLKQQSRLLQNETDVIRDTRNQNSPI
jgi:hypothetical protein